MLRPVPMRQLSIIVPKGQLHNLLVYAGQEQTLHLIDVSHTALPEGAERYDSSTILARSSTIRNRILSLRQSLGDETGETETIDAPVKDIVAFTDFLEVETARLEHLVKQGEESAAKLQTELQQTHAVARFLSGMESIGLSLETIGGSGFLSVLAGETDRESVPDVSESVETITYGNAVFAITGSSEKSQTFLTLFPAPFEEEARQAISAVGASLEPSRVGLPSDLSQARKEVDSRLEHLEKLAKEVEDWRSVLAKELGPRVNRLNVLAEVLDNRSRALAGSSTTQETSMLEAWIPEDRVNRFVSGASEACDGLASVHLEELRVGRVGHGKEHEVSAHSASIENSPPSLIRAPGWARPLQSVINSFGVPSYNEINPLVFMIISYPLIYGLMFGDFGQGPLFLLLGFYLLSLRKKAAKIPDIFQPLVNGAELILLLGVGITIFGFAFGDFFGFESKHIFGFPGLFSPAEGALEGKIDHLQTFMVIILLFGVGHYTFGLILSAYNKLSRKQYSEAFFGPICWAWFYLAGVYLIAIIIQAGLKFSLAFSRPDLVLFTLFPWMLMIWKEGGLHAIEAFLSALSHTFSYLRIWALNIADFFLKVALFTAFGIGGAVLGNLLVMVFEGLIVFVQTLRLHWVEWFSKFYEGGGLLFAPYREPTGWNVRVDG